MRTPPNQNENRTPNQNQAGAPSGAGSLQRDNSRSEALLPADQGDPDLQVAEEVAFDLQSDASRRVGAMPKDSPQAHPAEAMAEALQPDGNSQAPAPAQRPAAGKS